VRPVTPYESLILPLGRGLNLTDSPDAIEAGEALVLSNLAIRGQNSIGPRRASRSLGSVTGTALSVTPFPHGAGRGGIAISRNGSDLVLTGLSTQGIPTETLATVNAGLTADPVVSTAVIGRRLFVALQVGGRGTYGILYYDAVAGTATRPLFSFSEGGTPASLLANVCCEYNNMLFVAGYGTEGDINRPEVVRFSYLGLSSLDQVAAGDAGTNQDSQDLFDQEDYFMVGERGNPVRAMVPAMGRLLILSAHRAYSLFGYDRGSFQLEMLDNQHGTVATRAVVAAHGTIYWWSPLGPVRYTGSGVEPIGRKLGRKGIDAASVVAAHAPQEKEIQWWNGQEALCYNYQYDAWTTRLSPFAVQAAGGITDYSISLVGEVANPTAPSAPTNLQHPTGQITSASAISAWTPGDLSASTRIERRRTQDPEWQVVTTLGPGSSSHQHNDLAIATGYLVRIRHERDGLASAWVEAGFSTTQVTTLAPPTNLVALDQPDRFPQVRLTWLLGQTGVKTQIYRHTGPMGSVPDEAYLVATTPGTNDSQHWDDGVVGGSTTYYYRIRHVDPNAAEVRSVFNAAEVSVVSTGTPPTIE
jgi:hypothetical protein